MQAIRHFIRSAAVSATIAVLALTSGCSKPADLGSATISPKGVPASAPVNAPTKVQTGGAPSVLVPSKLGDLSAFSSIATEVASLVDQGNLAAAKTRIKDLEVAWDSAEAGLKPRAASDWHLLDKAVDHALSSLRTDVPNQAACQKTIAELLKTLRTLQGKI